MKNNFYLGSFFRLEFILSLPKDSVQAGLRKMQVSDHYYSAIKFST